MGRRAQGIEEGAARAATAALSRPVQIGALALRDIGEAHAWFERQQEGLGETFLARVDETIQRVEQNPEQ